MTSILEKFISVIAPNHCICCSKENNVLCEACADEVFGEPHQTCYLCDVPTTDGRPCPECQRSTPLTRVWMAGTYDGARRELVRKFKFARLRSAYEPLVGVLENTLPYLENVIVVPIPTASPHIRVRGYDHAALLAKDLAARNGWLYAPVLRRRHNLRQVGASKTMRARQAQSAFELLSPNAVAGKRVLIVDDVTTSGATVTAAARILTAAQPIELMAVVVAKHTLASR